MPESLSIQGSTTQRLWLQNAEAERRYVVKLSPLKLSTQTTVDFYFTDSVWSDVESFQYRPLILGDITNRQSLPSELLGGASRANGSLSIDNSLGDFDGWLTNYSWGGRSIRIYGSDPNNSGWQEIADYPRVISALIDRVEFSNHRTVVIHYTPETANANVDIHASALTVNEERWPIVYGRVYNVPGKPYTDDTILDSDRIFKISRYPVDSIDAVYVDRVAQSLDADYLTLSALDTAQASLIAGEYATCVAEGLFAVHSSADGVITCDVKGRDDSGPGYQDTAGEIVEDIAEDSAQLDSLKFPQFVLNDTPSDVFKTAAPQEIGFFLDGSRNVLDLIGDIVASVGGVYWWDNHGELCPAVWTAPNSSESQGTIDEITDIIGDTSVRAWEPPVYRAEVRYNRNYQTMDSGGLPSTVTGPQDFIINEWRDVSVADPETESKYENARQLIVETMMQQASEAAQEAQRLLQLHKVPRFVYKLRAWNRCGGYAIMDTWQLVHSRWAPLGKYVRVISVTDNFTQQYSDLELWG